MKKLLTLFAMSIMSMMAMADGGDLTPSFRNFAPTPPMGWNSWDCYYCSVKEKNVVANAEYMRDNLLKYGWEYVVVDIRWYTDDTGSAYSSNNYTMDKYGRYMPNVGRFPSAADGNGFKALADSIHNMGLKFGIHIMRGVPKKAVSNKCPIYGSNYKCNQIYKTDSLCTWLGDNYSIDCTKPGAQDYYNSIINMYAEWGVDFIKVDDLSRPYHDGEIWLIRNAIDQCGRDIVFSMSPGATPLGKYESCQNNANMWRMMDDFWDNWSDLLVEFTLCSNWNQYRRPGNYPDCDMLPLGQICITGSPRWTRFTENEQQTMMSLWSIFKSPLMFGGDLTYNDDWTLNLITNEDAININQNSENNRELQNDGTTVVWAADEPESDVKYAALFNLGNSSNWIRSNEALYSTETISLLSTGYSADVEVDIPQGSKVLALVVDDAGDGYSYDHGDWVNPTVVLADGSEVLLTKSDVISQNTSGSYYKYVNFNKNITSTGKMKINGVAYDNGFSAHANAMVLFALPENAVKFKGKCGIDDTGRTQSGSTSTIKFMVFNTDPTTRTVCNPAHAVANSQLVSRTFQSEGVWLEADITGAKKLYLVVTNAGDNFNYDHADWINPTLIDAEGNETKLTSIAYTSSVTDWYNISNYGKNVDGGTLNVNGTEYEDGIGTNSNSVIEYDLPGEYVTFRTFCGYDYAMKNAANGVTMEFLVYTVDPATSDSAVVALDLTQLGYDSLMECEVYDIWEKQTVGRFVGNGYQPSIVSHGCKLLKVTPIGIVDGIDAVNIEGKDDIISNSSEYSSKLPNAIYNINGQRVSDEEYKAGHDGVFIINENGKSKKVIRK